LATKTNDNQEKEEEYIRTNYTRELLIVHRKAIEVSRSVQVILIRF
jgi:hypothetical protein